MKNSILILLMTLVPTFAFAAGGHNEAVVDAPIILDDKVSLQKGAQLFINNCLGCHSAQYVRYERMATDLDIPFELVEDQMMFNTDKIGSPMLNAIPQDQAKIWFGTAPPDLSLVTRIRGADWVYSYLISFYEDEKRPWGVNNKVFADVGMPHVMSYLEEELGEEKFHKAMADLTNFLVYTAEPIRAYRESLGKKVLIFIFIFGIFAYLLNREYWKDVH